MKVALHALKMLMVSWICLAVTVSGFGNMVLCIGSDGHFSLESVHEGHCQGTADAPDQDHGNLPGTGMADLADSPGGCVDVLLSSEVLLQTGSKLRHTSRILQSPLTRLLRTPRDSGLGFRPPPGDARPSPVPPGGLASVLRAQQTVVLRI